ncbi:MAG: prefoldin beta subunit [Patescibacteria group bacterium]|jgi:prefoldin beta subunit
MEEETNNMKQMEGENTMGCGEGCGCSSECSCGPECSGACATDADNGMAPSEGMNATEGMEAPAMPGNPFGNLDADTQAKIQELQMIEQSFQQLLQQKNMFSMEINEADLIINETEKAEGEIFRIVGGQVVIKSTKEEVTKEMTHKKELMAKRMEGIDAQEKEFSEKIESIRAEVLSKIQG